MEEMNEIVQSEAVFNENNTKLLNIVKDSKSGIMSLIANDDFNSVTMNNSSDSINQFKLFLVAQAKNELKRIVKLTNYLDIIEDRFITTSNAIMAEYPDNLSVIGETMKTLIACINRSNELVTQIVSDEKLNSFVFNVKPSEAENNNTLSIESRNKIRDMANKLMLQLNDEVKTINIGDIKNNDTQ